MKKLMFAAVACSAVVAFGVPVADEIAYNFSASLRTTRGVPGADMVQSASCNIGCTAAENYWYNDAVVQPNGDILIVAPITDQDGNNIQDAAGNNYENVWIPGAVSADTGTGRHLLLGAFARARRDYTGLDAEGNLTGTLLGAELAKRLFAEYMECWDVAFNAAGVRTTGISRKYPFVGGGSVYCVSYTYSWIITGTCYRVPGAQTLTANLATANCCNPGNGNFTQYFTAGNVRTLAGAAAITPVADGANDLFYYFGSQAYTAAMQVETYAQITLQDGAGNQVFTGYLAGQGMLGQVARFGSQVTTLSGNIVGMLPPSRCVYYCCKPSTTAGAFICNRDTLQNGQNGTDTLATAGFGTFVLRYNAAETVASRGNWDDGTVL